MNNSVYCRWFIVVFFGALSINSYSNPIPLPQAEGADLTFVKYDKNGNGFISEKEFIAVHFLPMSKMTSENLPMHSTARATFFLEFDSNEDGALSKREFEDGQNIEKEKRNSMMIMMHGMRLKMPAYTDYDENGDGMISEGEFNDGQNKRINIKMQEGYQMEERDEVPSFSDVDINKDEQINQQEFTAHQLKRRKKGYKN
jgi:Ca2+-binding EF-hand superfamily protein